MNQKQQKISIKLQHETLQSFKWLSLLCGMLVLVLLLLFFIFDDIRGWLFLCMLFSAVLFALSLGLNAQRKLILAQQQSLNRLIQQFEQHDLLLQHHLDRVNDSSKSDASQNLESKELFDLDQINIQQSEPIQDHFPYIPPQFQNKTQTPEIDEPIPALSLEPQVDAANEVNEKAYQSTVSTEMNEETSSGQDVRTMTSLWRACVSWFKGGNSIVRIATIILLIGVVLLLRFASEYWQPTLSTKLAGVAIAGTVMTILGYRLRHKRYGYAISIQGAGLGVLFLVLFSAFKLDVVTSVGLSYGLLVTLLASTLWLALRQNALILAFIALGCGFIAPFILNTGSNNIPALFSYYLALNMGLAVIAYLKPWRILNTVSLFATFGIGGLSIWTKATPEQYGVLSLLVWLNFALYLCISIFYSLQAIRFKTAFKQIPLIDTALIFATPFMAFSLYAGLVDQHAQSLSIASAILAIVYFITGYFLHKKFNALTLLIQCFYGLGFTFFALILPFALNAQWTSVGWAVQALALIWLGSRYQLKTSVMFGLVLLICSAISWLIALWFDNSIALLAVTFLVIAFFASLYVLLTPEKNHSHLEDEPIYHAVDSIYQSMILPFGKMLCFVDVQILMLCYVSKTYELEQWTLSAWLMLISSVICAVLATRMFQHYKQFRISIQLFIACALSYFALIPLFVWEYDIVSIWWSLLGIVTVLLSLHFGLNKIAQLGAFALVASGFAVFIAILDDQTYSTSAVVLLMVVSVIAAYVVLYRQTQENLLPSDRVWALMLTSISFFCASYLGAQVYEALDWTTFSMTLGAWVWWGVLVVIYRRYHSHFNQYWLNLTLVLMGIGLADFVVLLGNTDALMPWSFSFDLRMTLLLVALGWLTALIFVYKHYAQQLNAYLSDVLMFFGLVILALFGGVWAGSSLSLVPCVLLLPVLVVLLSLKVRPFLFLQAFWGSNIFVLVFALTVLWTVSIYHNGTWSFTYIPVFNPIDLLSFGIFVITVLILQKYLETNKSSSERRLYEIIVASVLVLTGLLFISSLLLRSLHHYMNLPYWSAEVWSNGTVQASLTILWTILALALTTFASKKALRVVWLLGIAVLAIVIVKLIFLDLSHTQTLTRIVSFIGSGLIMLVIGYFAPLPPAEKTNDS